MTVLRDNEGFQEHGDIPGIGSAPQRYGDCAARGASIGEYELFTEETPPRMSLVAPFARADPSWVWRLANENEDQRHAFAIRTCSGCHGTEGRPIGGFGGAETALSAIKRRWRHVPSRLELGATR